VLKITLCSQDYPILILQFALTVLSTEAEEQEKNDSGSHEVDKGGWEVLV